MSDVGIETTLDTPWCVLMTVAEGELSFLSDSMVLSARYSWKNPIPTLATTIANISVSQETQEVEMGVKKE
jgi:hypothetical protein